MVDLEKRRAKWRRYYYRNREKMLARAKKQAETYYPANRERILAQQSQYAKINRDRFRARDMKRVKEWREKNPERARAASRKSQSQRVYSPAQLAKRTVALKAWQIRNRDRYLASKSTRQNRRRARLAGVLATLTVAQWEAILALHGGKCSYCGRSGKLTQDHVVPLSKGGGTTAENIVPACVTCNAKKGARTPSEWRPN